LGANYAFSKTFFEYIHGLKGLKSWGSSEPFLSIKSHLCGGSCKINTEIEMAHLFRPNAPYSTNVSSLVFNKIYLLKTLFPQELENKLMPHIPRDQSYREAIKMVEAKKSEIESEKAYYQGVFKYSMYDYCSRFNVEIP